jgi:phosphinothricin acetyltransferase
MAVRVKLRRAALRDLPALRDIYNEAVLKTTATFDTETKTLAERRKWLAAHRGYPVLVAEIDGEVLGWGCLTKWSDRCAYSGTAENSIYVFERARGRGLGTALLKALLAEARKMRLHTIVARITEGNAASVKLHKKFGFVKTGVMREVGVKFGRLLDVQMLQAFL